MSCPNADGGGNCISPEGGWWTKRFGGARVGALLFGELPMRGLTVRTTLEPFLAEMVCSGAHIGLYGFARSGMWEVEILWQLRK